jgi:hypothetical protein
MTTGAYFELPKASEWAVSEKNEASKRFDPNASLLLDGRKQRGERRERVNKIQKHREKAGTKGKILKRDDGKICHCVKLGPCKEVECVAFNGIVRVFEIYDTWCFRFCVKNQF